MKWLSLLALVLAGCAAGVTTKVKIESRRHPDSATTPADDPEAVGKASGLPVAQDQPPASFQGKVAPAVKWDLWGDWSIMRTGREDGKEGAPGRWEESWHPRRREDKSKLFWSDPARGETWTLIPGDGQQTGDRIRWHRYMGKVFDFSVNQQSPGLLILTDQDGENYLAVRHEGGGQ